MADIVAIVPVIRRPHRVAPLLESIAAATPDGAWRLLFVGSPGDHAEHDAVRAAGGDLLVIDEPNAPGDYSRKINHAYRTTSEPLMLLGGDDIHFHPGWLEAAAARMTDRVGVVGTNDLANRKVLAGEHSTHPVVARWYADRHGTIDGPGRVLHEGYAHNFCDNELVGTAKKRRAWAFAADSIVAHSHPVFGTAEMDEIYELGRSRFQQDRELWRRRRRMWN